MIQAPVSGVSTVSYLAYLAGIVGAEKYAKFLDITISAVGSVGGGVLCEHACGDGVGLFHNRGGPSSLSAVDELAQNDGGGDGDEYAMGRVEALRSSVLSGVDSVLGHGVMPDRSVNGCVGSRMKLGHSESFSVDGEVVYQHGQIPRGKNYEKNRAKRERKRVERKGKNQQTVGCEDGKNVSQPVEAEIPEWRRKAERVGYFDGCDPDQVKLLKESRMKAMIAKNEREILEHRRATEKATGKDSGLGLETKWKAENKLAELRAVREVEVMNASDVRDEVRRRRAQVTAATERNLVSIEMAHGSLKSNGDASEEDSSRINTVFSVGSGSISPNSSVSEAEVRKLQKDFEDLKISAAEYKASFSAKEKENASLRALLKAKKVEVPSFSPVVNPALSRSVYSLDKDGVMPGKLGVKLIKAFPDAYVSNYFYRVDPETGERRHFIRPKAFPPSKPSVRV